MKGLCAFVLAFFLSSAFAQLSNTQAELKMLDQYGRSLVASTACRNQVTKRRLVKNSLYPNITDEILEISCAGVKVTKYLAKSTNPAKIIPVKAEVSKQIDALPLHYAIGSSVGDMQAKLGRPRSQTKTHLTYDLAFEERVTDSITFAHRDGKITSVVWTWEVW